VFAVLVIGQDSVENTKIANDGVAWIGLVWIHLAQNWGK
jgi:hypothetical protein